MRRKTLDLLVALGGAVLVAVLLAAGILGIWAASWTNSNVRSQLAEQKISFPPAAAFAHPVAGTEITPSMVPIVSQYAGQQLLTGQQAEVYANNFIAVHLQEIGGGLTYSQLSTEARAATPGSAQATKLEGEVTTVFQGTTLRGLLLEAYGFSRFGQIAAVAALVSFILAGVMLILTIFGFVHYARVPEEVQFPKKT